MMIPSRYADIPPAHAAVLGRLLALLPAGGKQPPTKSALRREVTPLLKELRRQGTLDDLVGALVQFTGVGDLLPASYARFQAPVTEGMTFFLSRLPLSILSEKLVDQLRLPPDADRGQRIYSLVKDLSTIQKLGQIICRTPGIDPEFKKALTDLEDNIRTVTYARLRPALRREIAAADAAGVLRPEKKLLAEATVCAVIPAQLQDPAAGVRRQVVLKLVKPKVLANLRRELLLLEKLAAFLDSRRALWGLGRFNFQSTLERIKVLLENEVNLSREQENLAAAGTYHRGVSLLRIPQNLPYCTPRMTVMSRLDGRKITDVAGLSAKRRRLLAESLARTFILRPVQDLDEESVFHGDPHAGNLAYTFDDGQPRIILYDWSMAGRLKRLERFALVILTIGLMAGNQSAVFYAADIISKGQLTRDDQMREKAADVVEAIIRDPEIKRAGPLSAIEKLLEALTYQGVIFSSDLMMFEKALITLKGVLLDVDPGFNRADYVLRSAMFTFVADLVRLRLLKLVLEEIWSLYRYSFFLMLDIQRVVFKFLWDVGRLWQERPFRPPRPPA
jgi:ubiquinone biosynthesis protein